MPFIILLIRPQFFHPEIVYLLDTVLVTLCHLVVRVNKHISQTKHQQMAGTPCFTNCYVDQFSFAICFNSS